MLLFHNRPIIILYIYIYIDYSDHNLVEIRLPVRDVYDPDLIPMYSDCIIVTIKITHMIYYVFHDNLAIVDNTVNVF